MKGRTNMKKTLLVLVSTVILLCLIMAVSFAEEIILADNDTVAVKVTKMESTGTGFMMNVYLENKTSETVMFSVLDAVVNGYVADPFWAKEVAPGKKANSTIEWYNIADKGVTLPISKIDLFFRAYNSNDWLADAYL